MAAGGLLKRRAKEMDLGVARRVFGHWADRFSADQPDKGPCTKHTRPSSEHSGTTKKQTRQSSGNIETTSPDNSSSALFCFHGDPLSIFPERFATGPRCSDSDSMTFAQLLVDFKRTHVGVMPTNKQLASLGLHSSSR